MRWKKLAEACEFGIPDDQLERMAPVLEALQESLRRSLDRDLSTVEPAVVFRPDGR